MELLDRPRRARQDEVAGTKGGELADAVECGIQATLMPAAAVVAIVLTRTDFL